MPVAATVYPESRQWFGVGRELVPGTAVASAVSVPVEKGEPDDKPNFLVDKSIRGSMAEDFAVIQGTEIAEFNINGPVYIDTLGYFLHNILGDYQSTGTTPTSTTTVALASTAGATSFTVGAIGSIVIGSVLQVGNATISTAPTENVVVSAVAGSLVTFANTPLRFNHSATAAVGIVTAPFTHVFSLLNSGNGQPSTHTLTHYQGISGTYGAKQYANWCASEVGFTMDSQQLFMHDTKGTSNLGVAVGSAPTNVLSTAQAQADWQFLVGIAGPATGGTLISNVVQGGVTITRALKPYWTLAGQQSPFAIARNSLAITGKFNQLAQDESPMLNMLNNVQPQLQMVLTNGLSGANLLAVTIDIAKGAYDTAKLNGADEIEYDVTWRAVANSTNAGASGGLSPGKVTIQNAVGSY